MGRLSFLLAAAVLYCACSADEPKPVPRPQPVRIHPDFDLTPSDFEARLSNLPTEAASRPERFLELASAMIRLPATALVLVDPYHEIPVELEPRDPVSLDEFDDVLTTRSGLVLDAPAAESLARMSRDAAQEGVELPVSSAYRSHAYQEGLFRRYADQFGEEAASRFSARAGTSQHQLGTTVDFGDISEGFASTEAHRWLTAHAGRYGWSLSYPAGLEGITGYLWEPWHWRWIGESATAMQDEFFDGVQQSLLEFWSANAETLRNAAAGQSSESTS